MHRLDRDTSGIMLYAKSSDTSARYQKNLHRILLRKLYLAVVRGRPAWEEQDVQIPLREQPGNEIRLQMVPDEVLGKPCRTVFRRLDLCTQESYCALECELFTGRKHQIRAHLAALGHPIVGDPVYSFAGRYYLKRCHSPLDAEDISVLGASTQMLHAWKLELQLPGWRAPRTFTSRIWSDEMEAVLQMH